MFSCRHAAATEERREATCAGYRRPGLMASSTPRRGARTVWLTGFAALAALAALAVAPPPRSAAATLGPDPGLVPLASPAGDLPTGPRANGTAVLPDGRVVTPVGR